MYFSSRWDKGSGNTIDRYHEWYRGKDVSEPDLVEFDYSTRKFSPVTEEAFSKCSSNPFYDCYFEDTQCIKACPKNEISYTGCKQGLQCGCKEGGICKITKNPLFLDFEAVLATTAVSQASCMALYGPAMMPQILNQIQNGIFTEIDTCGVVADTIKSEHYLHWADVNCWQKTRAQICVLIGKH